MLGIKGITQKTQQCHSMRKEKKQQSLKSNFSTLLGGIYFNKKPIISVIIAAFTVTCNWCALHAHRTAGEEGALFLHSFPNLGKKPSTAARSQHACPATHPRLSPAKCFRKMKLNDPAPFIYSDIPDYNCDYMDWKYSCGWINEIQKNLKKINLQDLWEFWLMFIIITLLHFWSSLSFCTSAFGKDMCHSYPWWYKLLSDSCYSSYLTAASHATAK